MATVQYTVQYCTVSHRHFFMYSYIPCVTAITNYLSFKMAIEAQGYVHVLCTDGELLVLEQPRTRIH